MRMDAVSRARQRTHAGRLIGVAVAALAVCANSALAISLKEAVATALETNPEIGQAIENREAIEFELRQARGLYLPRIDLEGSYGARRFDSPGRRAIGTSDDTLRPGEIGSTVTLKLFDGFGREAEIERQASRVDGASHRVFERSEFIALAIAKEYFEILLQGRILKIAEDNIAFHQGIAGRIRAGLNGGSYTTADNQQAEERQRAARARIIEAKEELETARIRFFKLVGQTPSGLRAYQSLAPASPKSLPSAIELARQNNPRIKFAVADVDAAAALVKAARARYLPEVLLEGRARTGREIDGVEDRTSDLQGRVVTKWNIFNGGIDRANHQEQLRRLSEEKLRLATVHREVEEAIRSAWNNRVNRGELRITLSSQAAAGRQVVDAYGEQFRAGRRTLLDVLSAQNTYTATRVLVETAEYAEAFAVYRIMAATGGLVRSLGLEPPTAATAYAREQARVPPPPAVEEARRYGGPDRRNSWHVEVKR